MSKKKGKFDLGSLVHSGLLNDGDWLSFVSDPSKKCQIKKQPNGEFKVELGKEVITIHAVASRFLGTEPPEHASRWLQAKNGKTLYEIWKSSDEESLAA